MGEGRANDLLPGLPTGAGMGIVTDESLHRTQVSMDEFAAIAGLSRSTVRRRIADGTIRAVRIGRLVRIPLDQDFGRPLQVEPSGRP